MRSLCFIVTANFFFKRWIQKKSDLNMNTICSIQFALKKVKKINEYENTNTNKMHKNIHFQPCQQLFCNLFDLTRWEPIAMQFKIEICKLFEIKIQMNYYNEMNLAPEFGMGRQVWHFIHFLNKYLETFVIKSILNESKPKKRYEEEEEDEISWDANIATDKYLWYQRKNHTMFHNEVMHCSMFMSLCPKCLQLTTISTRNTFFCPLTKTCMQQVLY